MSDFDTQDYLTREETCTRLGISGNALWSRTRAGTFHPIRLGVRIYYPIEEVDDALRKDEEIRGKVFVAKLASPQKPGKKLDRQADQPIPPSTAPAKGSPRALSYSGEDASRAFGLFDEGANRRQVLEELKLRCDVIEHLYEKWQEFGDELHVPQKILKAMQDKLKWRQSPPTAKGLWIAIVRYVNQQIAKKEVYEPITEEERVLLETEESNELDSKAPDVTTKPSVAISPDSLTSSFSRNPSGASSPQVAPNGASSPQVAPSGASSPQVAPSGANTAKEDDDPLPFC